MPIGDVKSKERGSGARYNDGKPAYELVPLWALASCARVFNYGRRKYAEWNWAKGSAWSVPLGSILRHLSALQRGELVDPESGLPHTGHILCNALMLDHYTQYYPELNDLIDGEKYVSKASQEQTGEDELQEWRAACLGEGPEIP